MKCSPTKEFVIDAIRKFGLQAIYPNETGEPEAVIEQIRNTPDRKWYPADDIFWTKKEAK